MALSIKDPTTERLARELARETGESITEATRQALEERLSRVVAAGNNTALVEDLAAIRRRWVAMPILDNRRADDILGYDADGLPS